MQQAHVKQQRVAQRQVGPHKPTTLLCQASSFPSRVVHARLGVLQEMRPEQERRLADSESGIPRGGVCTRRRRSALLRQHRRREEEVEVVGRQVEVVPSLPGRYDPAHCTPPVSRR